MNGTVSVAIPSLPTFERTNAFYREVAMSKFLFRRPVQEYLEEVYNQAIRCYDFHLQLYPLGDEVGLPAGPDRSRVSNEQTSITLWMTNQRNGAVRMSKE